MKLIIYAKKSVTRSDNMLQFTKEMKRQALEDTCIREGLSQARDGRLLSELNYEELRHELAMHRLKREV